jgi:hypothetical protein
MLISHGSGAGGSKNKSSVGFVSGEDPLFPDGASFLCPHMLGDMVGGNASDRAILENGLVIS